MKTILITGAGSGIGRATALKFLAEGWTVGLAGRRPEPLEELAAAHGQAIPLPFDVTDAAAVDAGFAAFTDRAGRLDVVFNNAGRGAAPATIDEIDVAIWRAVVEVNLTGMFIVARAAFGTMRRQRPQGGRIINNGSISAKMPRPGSAPYTATKHGVLGLTRTIALDGRPFDIACGQIDIGNAESRMTGRMAAGVPQADGSIRAEPVMAAENVAETVFLMASLPPDANIQQVTVMATKMPYVGRG